MLSVCYEAGPSGYELHRLITSMGVTCALVTPSLFPKGASDRVETDPTRCGWRYRVRAGLLSAVRVRRRRRRRFAALAVAAAAECVPAGPRPGLERRRELDDRPPRLGGQAAVR
jgi:hypothetical protein